MEINPDFQYPDLLQGNASIRLLYGFTKNEELGMISCKMASESLDSGVDFKALSYTWGNPKIETSTSNDNEPDWNEASYAILCNDQPFFIRRNLFDALTRLQSFPSSQNHILWIDAICINQGDLAERGQQVGLMTKIYSHASSVIVWLGELDTDARNYWFLIALLAPWLEEMVKKDGWEVIQKRYLNDPTVYTHLPIPENMKSKLQSPEEWPNFIGYLQETGLFHPNSDKWKSYTKFMQWTWFSRTWILQELVMAKEVLVTCGDLGGNPNQVWNGMKICNEYISRSPFGGYISGDRDLSSRGNRPGYRLSTLHHLRELYWSDESISPERTRVAILLQNTCGILLGINNKYYAHIWYLLMISRHFDATDPRDKIFGTLGLVSKFLVGLPSNLAVHVGITPDYKASVERVYQITAHRMIMNLQYLPLLSLREDFSVRKIHSLPSWVPDFSAFDKHHVDPLCVAMDGLAYDVLHQTGNMPREIKGNILSVQGALLDTIEEPSPYWGEVLNFQTIINITWLGLKIPSPYKNGQDRVDVLWRSLIGDTDGVASPAPQSIGQNFYNFILDQLTKALVEQFSQVDSSGTDLFRNRGLFNKLKSETQAEHGFPDLDDAYINFEKAMAQQQQTGNVSAKQIPIPKIDDHFIDMAKFVQRRLWMTKRQMLGMGPRSSEEGDQVWAIKGSKVPMLLRPVAGSTNFVLVGECYVHGIMHGELVDSKERELEWSEINLE